jgi:hypothetical protein
MSVQIPDWLRGWRYSTHGGTVALASPERARLGSMFTDKCPLEDQWEYLPPALQRTITNASLIIIEGATKELSIRERSTTSGTVAVWPDRAITWRIADENNQRAQGAEEIHS